VPLKNGPHGYGLVTKTLHWLTVLLVAAQFTVGYLMDGDDGGHGRGRGHGHGSGHGRGGGDHDFGGDLLPLHVGLGVTILAVAVLRVGWRRSTDLPPWDERLSGWQRIWAHRTEQVLLSSLFVIPLTGLGLLLGGEDDYLWVHVAAHVVFFAALASHLTLNLGKGLLPRML
jgi:cytochrome b561